jgi:predicted alpha-1,2-mannosidase
MKYLFAFIVSIISNQLIAQNENFTQFVNPFIGTGGHGHTFPGATQPFAMVQLSPDTRIDGSWDGCSGYHYSDSIIYGFSHTHLSGTGCSDYGDIAFLPTFTDKSIDPKYVLDEKLGISFSHKNEHANAGYYEVTLDNGVKVELTSTTRVGLQKYTYPRDGFSYIKLNLKHRDELLEGKINEINTMTYSGLRRSKAWASNQELYYYFQMSKSPLSQEIIKGKNGDDVLLMYYRVKKGESILIKTALSGVDITGAKNNLEKEMPDFDFEKYKINANNNWNKELSKIKVFGNTTDKKINFYTALYHCMIHPSIMNDVDNRYKGRDAKIHSTEGKFDYYSVFSLWDTYRALHPLLTLIDEKRTNDFVQTFIKQYEQAGRLPVWELWGNETNCMIGYHAVSVIWDAYNKGIKNYDATKAYEAMKSIATEKTDALDSYLKYGYIRADDDAESVSKTLEYAYDDWCIAQMALELNKEEDYNYFMQRSQSWKNVYDPITGFMRARKNGTLYEPFSPYMVDNNYTEANSFQYSFYMPHALDEYESMIGGRVNFDKKLNQLFTAKPNTEGREQADITGLIGQYAHGNEPSHHIAYLIKDEKLRKLYIDYIIDSFYKNAPDGLIGNEDCGQMSAWYVWACVGMYPVCPGKFEFVSNTSIFDSIYLCTNNQSQLLNINSIYKYYKRYGNAVDYSSLLSKPKYVASPFIYPTQKIFKDSTRIKISNENTVYYSLNYAPFVKYENEITLKDKSYIQFYAIDAKIMSPRQEAYFYKLPNDREVILQSTYNPQYHAGGAQGLIDGVHGDINWRKGDWQGYQGQDVEVIIKLNNAKNIKNVSTTFLQDQRSWIFFPKGYEIYTSLDGINYELKSNQSYTIERDDDKNSIKTLSAPINTNCKYIKIIAKNYGKVPAWHPGAGGDSFIFIDEVSID